MSREAFENNLLQNMELRTVFMSYPTTFLNPLNCLYTKKDSFFYSKVVYIIVKRQETVCQIMVFY